VEFRKKGLLEELCALDMLECALDMLEEQRGLAPEEKFKKSEVIRDMKNATL
jgi:hypothetical protein